MDKIKLMFRYFIAGLLFIPVMLLGSLYNRLAKYYIIWPWQIRRIKVLFRMDSDTKEERRANRSIVKLMSKDELKEITK